MNTPHRLRGTGFTLVELLVTVALIAIILAVAVPGFGRFLDKKRVEGVAAELATDLQLARSEAVSRNATVRVTFGVGCYVIHTLPTSGTTTCTQAGGAALGTGAVPIKALQVSTGSTAQLGPAAAAFIEFEPVRGMSASSNLGTPATMGVSSTSGGWSLSMCVGALGRVATFTTSGVGRIQGYATACPT